MMGLLATYKPSNIDNFYHEATILVVPRTMAPIFFPEFDLLPIYPLELYWRGTTKMRIMRSKMKMVYKC